MIRYEDSTGKIVVEWYERKKNASSPTHHYFAKQPYRLQLHPIDGTVIRAVFKGVNMPGWMERYAENHDYDCQQVTHNGEVGFWISNWRVYPGGKRPFVTPSVKGALKKFQSIIPDGLKHLRQKIEENEKVILTNLSNHPKAFEKNGLYYRPEEIASEGGALVLDDDIILSQDHEESDDEYIRRILKDGRLERLVNEIIRLLPPPDIEEMDEYQDIEIEDESIDIDFEEQPIEFDDENIELEETEDDEVIIIDFDNEGVSSDSIEHQDIEDSSEIDIDSVGNEDATVIPEKRDNDIELKVTQTPDKKVVTGQFELF